MISYTSCIENDGEEATFSGVASARGVDLNMNGDIEGNTVVPRTMRYVIRSHDRESRTRLFLNASSQLSRATDTACSAITLREDYDNNIDDDSGQLGRLKALLTTREYGRNIVQCLDPVKSTQDVLLRGSPFKLPFCNGTLVYPSMGQVNGRGRNGTTWTSIDNNESSCTFSLEIHLPNPTMASFVQYIIALAIVQCYSESTIIKWPNDILDKVTHKKVGGILCEGTIRDGNALLVVGIGLNLNIHNDEYGCIVDTDSVAVVAKFLNRFEPLMDDYFTAGNFFAGNTSLHSQYTDLWMHSHQTIYMEDEEEYGTIMGIAQNGSIQVERSKDGSRRDCPPDLDSLDVVKGILRKKSNE